MAASGSPALTASDLIQLIALLIGVIFGVAFLFQRIAEWKLRRLVALKQEVKASIEALHLAVRLIEESQQLHGATLERVIRSLDIATAYLEASAGVTCDILALQPENPNIEFTAAQFEVMKQLRSANDELRLLSSDPLRRHSAVKNIAFGRPDFRSLEVVRDASKLYPADEEILEFSRQLAQQLRNGVT